MWKAIISIFWKSLFQSQKHFCDHSRAHSCQLLDNFLFRMVVKWEYLMSPLSSPFPSTFPPTSSSLFPPFPRIFPIKIWEHFQPPFNTGGLTLSALVWAPLKDHFHSIHVILLALPTLTCNKRGTKLYVQVTGRSGSKMDIEFLQHLETAHLNLYI